MARSITVSPFLVGDPIALGPDVGSVSELVRSVGWLS